MTPPQGVSDRTEGTTAASCSPMAPARTFPPPSPTSAPSMSASRPAPTLIRAMSRPSTASSKTSSSTWRLSAAALSSWPRLPSTSSTSTWLAPIRISEVSPHGRSSSNSLPASPSASACFLPPSSTIVSMCCVETITPLHRGDTMYQGNSNLQIVLTLLGEFSRMRASA